MNTRAGAAITRKNRFVFYRSCGVNVQSCAHYWGFIYNDLGQYEQVLADFDRAIELALDLAIAYVNRGLTYANLGQYEQALADFREYVRLAGENVDPAALEFIAELEELLDE